MKPIRLPLNLDELLKAIHDYYIAFGKPPYRKNKWLCDQLNQSSNYISNMKSELIKMRYLTDRLEFTPRGREYYQIYFGAFSVEGAEIRVQGLVSAGSSDEALVNYDEFGSPSDKTIMIPNVSMEKDVFALQVNGSSMVELGILEGDYVIVEKQGDLWWPQPQDIIITKYLPHDPNRSLYEETDPDEFQGPVLKVYLKRVGERGCKLGWKRNNENNPYIIEADALQPIAKVSGVYRDIKSSSVFML